MSERREGTVVLGVGNPLFGDDGLGLEALARLRHGWPWPDHLRFEDGGTWGMNLLPVFEAAAGVLILDAIDVGFRPGTLVLLERSDVPAGLGLKVSPHQVDLREVFALAQFRGTLPPKLAAIGLQPGSVEQGIGLSPVVERNLEMVLGAAVERLERWGTGPMALAAHA